DRAALVAGHAGRALHVVEAVLRRCTAVADDTLAAGRAAGVERAAARVDRRYAAVPAQAHEANAALRCVEAVRARRQARARAAGPVLTDVGAALTRRVAREPVELALV